MFKKLKEKTGYVSIETVVVVGLVLLMGITIMISLYNQAKETSASSLGAIEEAQFLIANPLVEQEIVISIN